MIAHLPLCRSWVAEQYPCNCGADAQNDLAARLDALPPVVPSFATADAAIAAEDAAKANRSPPPDTPLRAVARMLDRLHTRACHHDSPRHLLATAYAAVELAAGALSPEIAISILDGVEPTPTGDGANALTR